MYFNACTTSLYEENAGAFLGIGGGGTVSNIFQKHVVFDVLNAFLSFESSARVYGFLHVTSSNETLTLLRGHKKKGCCLA